MDCKVEGGGQTPVRALGSRLSEDHATRERQGHLERPGFRVRPRFVIEADRILSRRSSIENEAVRLARNGGGTAGGFLRTPKRKPRDARRPGEPTGCRDRWQAPLLAAGPPVA